MSNPSDIVRKYIRRGMRVGGRYDVEDFIGSGAYGAIFSAIDIETMERVAVKAIPPGEQGSTKTAEGRFRREMKVISRLRHPNIIALYDYGQTPDGLVYMVLEYIDGQTLYDLVTSTMLDDGEAISITQQIAAGLAEAHSKGVIHRDLKPQNVMVISTPKGYSVKVLDFGMAKLLSGGDDSSLIQLTREGVAVGTPRYIAPEQARGKEVGPYSDIYALGLLFYETFTGQRAVKADTIESAIIAHVSPEPLQLEEIDQVPRYARKVLYKMIEKKVSRRYQNAGEVLRDLNVIEQQRMHLESAATVPVGEHRAPEIELDVPQQARTGRIRSIHSSDNLEVDFAKAERADAGQRDMPLKMRRKVRGILADTSGFYLRTPHNIFEWAETAAAVFVAPFALLLFTAHFEGMDYFLRLFVGVVPMVGAVLVGLYLKSSDWMYSVFRLWFATSLLFILLAHIMGTEDLAIGLLRNPAWYLSPVKDVPVLSGFYDVLSAFSRSYADLIADRNLRV